MLVFIKLEINNLYNVIQSTRKESLLRFWVIILGAIMFWVALFLVFSRIFRFLSSFSELDLSGWFLHMLMSVFFFFLFTFIIISSCLISYALLYKNKETEFLLTQPISLRKIFFYKFLKTFGLSTWCLIFLFSPFLVVYTFHNEINILLFILYLIIFLIFLILPTCIGFIIAFTLPLLLPNGLKLRHVIIISFLLILILSPNIFIHPHTTSLITNEWLLNVTNKFLFLESPFLPTYWLTKIFEIPNNGEIAIPYFYISLLISYALFLLFWCSEIFSLAFLKIYRKTFNFSEKVSKATILLEKILSLVSCWLKGPQRALSLKDLKLTIRDPKQWGQFFILFGILTIYLLSPSWSHPHKEQSIIEPFWQKATLFFNFASILFILATLTVRFLFPQFSLESRKLWLLKPSHLSLKSTVLTKLYTFTFIASLITILLTILALKRVGPNLSNFYQDSAIKLFSLSSSLLASFALCSSSIGLGILYPDFNHNNSAEIVSSFGGTITMLLNLAITVCFLILIGIAIYSDTFYLPPFWKKHILWIDLLIMILFTLLVYETSIGRGLKKLQHDY